MDNTNNMDNGKTIFTLKKLTLQTKVNLYSILTDMCLTETTNSLYESWHIHRMFKTIKAVFLQYTFQEHIFCIFIITFMKYHLFSLQCVNVYSVILQWNTLTLGLKNFTRDTINSTDKIRSSLWIFFLQRV